MTEVFTYPYRVIYADCTVGDHIYYSRYLDLLEAARGEFFRGRGIPLRDLQAENTTFPVIECRLRYQAPARYDDELSIGVWITKCAGARLNFAYRITRQEEVILEGETWHVCADLEGKPRRLPEEVLGRMTNGK